MNDQFKPKQEKITVLEGDGASSVDGIIEFVLSKRDKPKYRHIITIGPPTTKQQKAFEKKMTDILSKSMLIIETKEEEVFSIEKGQWVPFDESEAKKKLIRL